MYLALNHGLYEGGVGSEEYPNVSQPLSNAIISSAVHPITNLRITLLLAVARDVIVCRHMLARALCSPVLGILFMN